MSNDFEIQNASDRQQQINEITRNQNNTSKIINRDYDKLLLILIRKSKAKHIYKNAAAIQVFINYNNSILDDDKLFTILQIYKSSKYRKWRNYFDKNGKIKI